MLAVDIFEISICRRGAVSAGLPRGAARSGVHACWRQFRDTQDAVVNMATGTVTPLRASGPLNSRLEPGRWCADAICRHACGISGAVPLPRHLVRCGELLGAAHRLAGVQTDDVRTRQMVPQDTLLVCSSTPHRHLLSVGADVDCYAVTLVLPAGGLSVILTVQVGQERWPTADSARRGHCNVMPWPIMCLIL